MKILALDHFFGQDLASLRRHAAARHQLCAIDYRFFRERFQRLLPDSVLGSDLAAYAAPEHATARAAWRRECRAALHELYALFEFDLVILPSDIFPYVRDLIPAAHELGAPVVVVQKETTISPHTLEVHAGNVGASTPFISDHMTVCSERQKQFWLNAGSAPERIDVTGQPRFDFYRDPSQWCGWDELGVKVMPEREVILFLSYSPGAYIPIEDFESGRLSWEPLRSQTEETLLRLVNTGRYQLLVKPHPQQPLADVARTRARLERDAHTPGSAQVLPATLDTRQLLVNSDVIVGFQTTALLEALLLDRAVIYTCWGDAYEACKEAILPYEDHPRAIHSARSADELAAFVRGGGSASASLDGDQRLALYEYYLGPSDGEACERTLAILERAAAQPVAPDALRTRMLQRALARARDGRLRTAALRWLGELLLDVPAAAAAWCVGLATRDRAGRHWAAEQLGSRLARGRELAAALRGRGGCPERLIGQRPSPWLAGLRHWRRSRV